MLSTPSLLMAIKDLKLFLWCVLISGIIAALQHAYIYWDFANYHWYNAFAFLHHRMGFDLVPAQMQTYFNPVLDIFNYGLIHALVYTPLFEFVFGVIWGINFFLLIKIASLLFSYLPKNLHAIALIAAVIIGVSGTNIIPQLGLFTDPEVDVFVLLAFYCFFKALHRHNGEAWPFVLIAGLCMGLALGLKLTILPFLPALILAFMASAYSWRQCFILLLVFGAGFMLMFLLTDGFWMWTLYASFKNPFFPMFNGFFHSPYAALDFAKDDRYIPRSIYQWLFYPLFWMHKNRLTSEQALRDGRLGLILILFLPCLLKALMCRESFIPKPEQRFWRFFIVFMLVSYVVWLGMFSIYRYLVPVVLLSGIILVAQVLYLCASMRFIYQAALVIALAIGLVVSSIYPIWGRLPLRIDIQIPPVAAQSLVIMDTPPFTPHPFAYLIPYFPANTRFVGAYNNMMKPGAHNLLQTQADALILHFSGQEYFIESPRSYGRLLLAAYGFAEVPGSCVPIYSNLEKPGTLRLCKVEKL